jgi:chromosomal replication initiator protein
MPASNQSVPSNVIHDNTIDINDLVTLETKTRWKELVFYIRNNNDLSSYDLVYLYSLRPLLYSDEALILSTTNPAIATGFESRLSTILSEAILSKDKLILDVSIQYNAPLFSTSQNQLFAEKPVVGSSLDNNKNPAQKSSNFGTRTTKFQVSKFKSFDDFVVGESNLFAYGCSQAISNHYQAKNMNPFFVVGDHGLGKSHLLQSICATALKRNPSFSIQYISAEKYYTDFVEAQNLGKTKFLNLQKYYKSVDLLAIDDFDWVFDGTAPRGDGTIFSALIDLINFHTMNGRRVVLSSSTNFKSPPIQNESFSALLSRAFMTTLEYPNTETKLSFLQNLLYDKKIALQVDVLESVSSFNKCNFCDLINIAQNIISWFGVFGESISAANLKNVLFGYLSKNKSVLRMPEITAAVSAFLNVNERDVIGSVRFPNVVFARQVSIYFCRKLTEYTTTQIGSFFSGKNHSTIVNSTKKICELIRTDDSVSKIVQDIENTLAN